MDRVGHEVAEFGDVPSDARHEAHVGTGRVAPHDGVPLLVVLHQGLQRHAVRVGLVHQPDAEERGALGVPAVHREGTGTRAPREGDSCSPALTGAPPAHWACSSAPCQACRASHVRSQDRPRSNPVGGAVRKLWTWQPGSYCIPRGPGGVPGSNPLGSVESELLVLLPEGLTVPIDDSVP